MSETESQWCDRCLGCVFPKFRIWRFAWCRRGHWFWIHRFPKVGF